MESMSILLTGSEGFIGSYISKLERDTDPFDLKLGQDLCDPAVIAEALQNCEAVINVAGEVRVPRSHDQPEVYWRNNCLAAVTLFRAARRSGTKVIHASTSVAPYGGSHYALSKRAAEVAAQEEIRLGADIVVLRLANIYGPKQPDDFVIPLFLKKALQNEALTLHNGGRQLKDYVHVEDVARAFLVALDLASGSIADVGSGVKTSVKTLAAHVLDVTGSRSEIINMDDRARLSDPDPAVDITLMRSVGWEPKISLREGLHEMYSL
jgi:UDP-glucose 4-epimerase